MARCSDKSIGKLNDKGYNVVKLPRAGIEPMDWIGRDERATECLGPVGSVLINTAMPPASTTSPVAELSGQQSSKLDVGIGLRVLGNVLQAFGASTPSLDGAFAKAKTLTFTYGNVTSTKVDVGKAAGYLGASSAHPGNPLANHYLLDDDTTAYLITEVLKSNEISITATDANGANVPMDAGVIQGLVGGKVNIKADSSSAAKLTLSGATPVTFGFKAFEISFDNGAWRMRGAGTDGGLAFAAVADGSSQDVGEPVLLGPGMLRLK